MHYIRNKMNGIEQSEKKKKIEKEKERERREQLKKN